MKTKELWLWSGIVCSIVLCGTATLQAQTKALKSQGSSTAGSRQFGEILGLQVKFNQGQPQEAGLASLHDLGVRWVRDNIDWAVVEKTPGVYALPSAFRERLAFYKKHGMSLVLPLGYGNPIAYPPTADDPDRPWDPEAYGRYAGAMTRMLKESGVHFAISLWNEPHNFELGQHFGGAWNGVPPCPWLNHYLKMVSEAVKNIKAVDPSVVVLTDEDVVPNHYYFIKAGLPRELDGYSVHYPSVDGVPEKSSFTNDQEFVRPLIVVDKDKSVRSELRRLREAGAAAIGREPQIWILEWGTPVDENVTVNVQHHTGVAENDVAVMLARAFITAEANGVQVVAWFSAYDGPDGPFGLQANDLRPRLAYYTYKTLSEQLGDFTRVRQLAGNATPASGTQAYLYRRGAEQKIAVWRIDGPAQSLALTGALAGVRVIDKLGKVVDVPEDARGVRQLPIGPSVQYLCGLPPSSAVELDEAMVTH